jgi:hypothetical protein
MVIGSRIEIIRTRDKHPGCATLEVLNIPRISDLDPASEYKPDPDPAININLIRILPLSKDRIRILPLSLDRIRILPFKKGRILILPLNIDQIRNMPL